jgi:hypothetical protein
MKRPKGYADRTMMTLWRRAVLQHWGYRDPISGHYDPSGESLQCHHIASRRHWLLRYDWRNGIPLTVESHGFAHTGEGHDAIRALVDVDYLNTRERLRKKDYMMAHGVSEAEILRDIKDELIGKIEEGTDGD